MNYKKSKKIKGSYILGEAPCYSLYFMLLPIVFVLFYLTSKQVKDNKQRLEQQHEPNIMNLLTVKKNFGDSRCGV